MTIEEVLALHARPEKVMVAVAPRFTFTAMAGSRVDLGCMICCERVSLDKTSQRIVASGGLVICGDCWHDVESRLEADSYVWRTAKQIRGGVFVNRRAFFALLFGAPLAGKAAPASMDAIADAMAKATGLAPLSQWTVELKTGMIVVTWRQRHRATRVWTGPSPWEPGASWTEHPGDANANVPIRPELTFDRIGPAIDRIAQHMGARAA